MQMQCLSEIDKNIDQLQQTPAMAMEFVQDGELVVSVIREKDKFKLKAHNRDHSTYEFGTFDNRDRLKIALDNALVSYCFNRFKSLNATLRMTLIEEPVFA